MVQIIAAPEGFGTRFAKGLGRGLSGEANNTAVSQFGSMLGQMKQQDAARNARQAENQSTEENFGLNLKGINDPKMRQEAFKEALKNQNMSQKDFLKQQEKIAPIQSGLETIARMREIRAKDNLGRGSKLQGLLGGETAKDRGEYSQLGKSLISLSTNIPIRNRIEFETLAEKLYDPSISDKEAEGVLNAMEQILGRSLPQQGNENNGKKQSLSEIFG